MNTSFLLQAWLRVQPDLRVIQPFVVNYLQHNSKERNASFVLKAWLDANGDFGVIQPFLINYLKYNSQEQNASFMLTAWLKAKVDLELIQPFLVGYLQRNASNNNAIYVFIACLNSGFPCNSIDSYLHLHLQAQGRRMHMINFFQSAMQLPDYKTVVESYILRWISANLTQVKAIGLWVDWVLTYEETDEARKWGALLLAYHQRTGTLQQYLKALPAEGSAARAIIARMLPTFL